MAAAVAAARRGSPSPNPHVGAVLVDASGAIVAEGHHERAGLAHAEVAALDDLERRTGSRSAAGLTMYVTLEPCNHFGRTPPCTLALIDAGVERVVVGQADPAPHVPGASERLRGAGIEVEVGVLGDACADLVADFSKHITTGLPWVVLKAAVTLDGKMATAASSSKWITGEDARRRAHELRAESDAVLVGVRTVLFDDPRLNVREVPGASPRRVVLDTTLRTPPTAALFSSEGGPVWLLHGPGVDAGRAQRLRNKGAELFEIPVDDARPERLDLEAALRVLGEREVVRLLVEGGATVHGALLGAGLADEAAVFVAPRILGDAAAPGFAEYAGTPNEIHEAWQLEGVVHEALGPDVLFRGRIRGRRTRRRAGEDR